MVQGEGKGELLNGFRLSLRAKITYDTQLETLRMDNSRARQAFCHSYKSIYAAMVMRECRSWVWAQLLVLFHLPRLLLSVLHDLILATHCKKTKLKGKN